MTNREAEPAPINLPFAVVRTQAIETATEYANVPHTVLNIYLQAEVAPDQLPPTVAHALNLGSHIACRVIHDRRTDNAAIAFSQDHISPDWTQHRRRGVVFTFVGNGSTAAGGSIRTNAGGLPVPDPDLPGWERAEIEQADLDALGWLLAGFGKPTTNNE